MKILYPLQKGLQIIGNVMRNLEIELNKKLPNSIKQIIEGLPYTIDTVGESNSLVVIFEDYILKISTLSFDIQNELRVYNTLKDKIPIPKIIECVKENNSIYLLKEKLKGNMLSDPYYMERPELLYKLASEAIQLLWSIDIKNLDLMNTYDTIMEFGCDCNQKGYLDFKESDSLITKDFSNFDEIIEYLKKNKPIDDNVLCHGDLCIPNIICDGDKLVGFIDLGLMGISNRYHDLAILYRSIKYNFNGTYGKCYLGYDDNRLFELLGIKRNDELIRYYLLLDEILG